MKSIRSIVGILILSWASFVSSDEADGILQFLPAIISASQQSCDLSEIDRCRTERICTNSDGYWYSDKCNIDPLGLVLIRRLSGTWNFYFRSNNHTHTQAYMFFRGSIRPAGNQGDYEIEGTDITSTSSDRPITAKYRAKNGSVIVHANEKLHGTPPGPTFRQVPEDWFMDFASATELTGVHNFSDLSPHPLIPLDPAWAIKR